MWSLVGSYTLDKSWTYTNAFSGEFIRIRHSQPNRHRAGLVAQASIYAPVELYNIKRLYPKAEVDLYHFSMPDCWTEQAIALKGNSADIGLLDFPWIVTIEVWE